MSEENIHPRDSNKNNENAITSHTFFSSIRKKGVYEKSSYWGKRWPSLEKFNKQIIKETTAE